MEKIERLTRIQKTLKESIFETNQHQCISIWRSSSLMQAYSFRTDLKSFLDEPEKTKQEREHRKSIENDLLR